MMEVVTADGGRLTIGTVETGSTVGIIDYSRRVTDDFGVTTVVQRGFARRLSVRLAVPFDDASALQRRLADLRATSAQWVADARFAWLSPTGFYKDFDIDVAVRPLSYCTLSVEGLAETAPVADPGGDPAPNGRRSTLQLLQPYTVTEAILTASSIAEDDAPAWSGVTGYIKGARVLRQHRVYEALNANKAADPLLVAGGQWLDTGPSKRWAPFDQALGTVAQADGLMTMRLETARIEGVALLDVTGATVRVQADGYDRTQAVTGGAVTFLDLGGKARVTVTIAGAGSVSVGTLLIGRVVALGTTEAAPTAGITDFSRKTVDDFGEVTIAKRGYAKRMTAKALIRTDALDIVANRIATVRAMPSLWIGQDGLDCLTVYGFFRDFSIEVGPGVSKLSLSIEGLSAADKAAPLVSWPDIGDPNGTKPKDNADKTSENTAKDTAAVGGRDSQKFVSDFDRVQTDLKSALTDIGDINTDLTAALGKFDGVFETVELLTPSLFDVVRMFGTLNSYMRARTTLEGMPIGTVVVETREKTDSAVEDLKLLGARSLDGTAFSLDLTTVMVDAKTSLAQRFTQIEAKGAGDLNALASSLTTAITEGDRASATRLETLEVGAKGISAKVQSLQEAVIDGDDSLVRQLSTLKASNSLMSTTIKDLEEATVSGTNSVAKRVGVIESSLNTADTGVWARIGKAEQVIIANNTATLSKFEELNAAIYSPNGGVKATIADLVEATLTGDTSVAKRVSTIELSLNAADTGVWARIGTAEQAIVTQGRVFGERISTLEVGLNTPGTGVWARIGTAEQAITEQGRSFASRISVIEAGLNTPETGVWARVGSAEQAITTVNSALATFKQDVTASLDTPGTGLKAKVGLLLSATVDPQNGAEAKAVLALDSQGLVSGIVGTNNGTVSRISFKFSQTDFFRPDGTLLLRIGNASAGEDPNAVYMPNVVVDRLKADTVQSQHIQKGAASASRFAVLTQDASVARVATYQNIATVSFKKEEAGSYILVRTSLNCRSQDDLQFIVAMSVSLEGGGTYTVSSETNMVFDNTNSLARMPISPFALFSDPAVLAHVGYVAINISIRNTEVDNIPLIIAAGSLVEFVEVKGAMLGA